MKTSAVPIALLLAAAASGAPPAPDFARRTVNIAGTPREFLLRIPAGPANSPLPLILMLHGHLGSAANLTGTGASRRRAAPYRAWAGIADREHLILAAPDGTIGPDRQRGWNDCRGDAASSPRSDDVSFLVKLVDAVDRERRVDRRRIFVVGTSNGGFMALRMAVEKPALVAAAAAVIAAMPAKSQCREPAESVPVLFMNGTADRLVPFNGGAVAARSGGHGLVLSARDSVEIWRKLAGISAGPEVKELASHVVRETYSRDGKARVVLYRIEGGGHLEPSRRERYAWPVTALLGQQNAEIEMAEEVWAFFAAR